MDVLMKSARSIARCQMLDTLRERAEETRTHVKGFFQRSATSRCRSSLSVLEVLRAVSSCMVLTTTRGSCCV